MFCDVNNSDDEFNSEGCLLNCFQSLERAVSHQMRQTLDRLFSSTAGKRGHYTASSGFQFREPQQCFCAMLYTGSMGQFENLD